MVTTPPHAFHIEVPPVLRSMLSPAITTDTAPDVGLKKFTRVPSSLVVQFFICASYFATNAIFSVFSESLPCYLLLDATPSFFANKSRCVRQIKIKLLCSILSL